MSSVAPPPAYPAWPPPPPAPPRRRRWPLVAGVAIASAVLAAAITAVITTNMGGAAGGHTATTTTRTVTVTPPSSSSPEPLPTAQADARTCAAWLSAGDLIHAASTAQSVIPKGTTIVDPSVRNNPTWTSAVQKAADLYGQAGDTLTAGIAPGATPMLAETATTVVDALRTLSTTTRGFDDASGNAYSVTKEAGNAMDVLCNRLAPR